MSRITLILGSDHAGLVLKEFLKTKLQPGSSPSTDLVDSLRDCKIVDLGTSTSDSCDYPDFAAAVARKVSDAAKAGDANTLGLLICGSGIGMSIAANKVDGVRAALVWDVTSARLSREHNNSNVLCLGQRLVGEQVAWDALQAWVSAKFLGGRHNGRIDKITQLEKN